MNKVLSAVLATALLTAPVVLAQAADKKAPSAQATRAAHMAAEFIEIAGTGAMFEVLSSDLPLKRAAQGVERQAGVHRAIRAAAAAPD